MCIRYMLYICQIGAASLPSPEQFPLITPENQEQHSELIQALHTALLDVRLLLYLFIFFIPSLYLIIIIYVHI